MVGDNNQSNTEDTNSEIRNTIFLFKRTNEASVSNSKILAAFNGDLKIEITSQKGSPLNH